MSATAYFAGRFGCCCIKNRLMGGKMRISVLIFLCCLTLGPANAEKLDTWYSSALKQGKPDELPYYLARSEACGFTVSEGRDIVDSLFLRNKIKPLPLEQVWQQNLYLNLAISCVDGFDPGWKLFSIDIRFGDNSGDTKVLYNVNYSWIGYGPIDHIKGTLKDLVQPAITDYVKANSI